MESLFHKNSYFILINLSWVSMTRGVSNQRIHMVDNSNYYNCTLDLGNPPFIPYCIITIRFYESEYLRTYCIVLYCIGYWPKQCHKTTNTKIHLYELNRQIKVIIPTIMIM